MSTLLVVLSTVVAYPHSPVVTGGQQVKSHGQVVRRDSKPSPAQLAFTTTR